mgnify:CR=1 FL=1
MDTLPILKQNAFLTVLIKDNRVFANLAFTDFLAQKTYILSDITDLSPLKFRMDDIVFNKQFWWEYFNALEKEFDWNMVDRKWNDIFKVVPFQSEGEGISGIKVLVDDNQPFFNKIYLSLKDFSRDLAIRIVDNKYMMNLMDGLVRRLEYKDLIWIDMDLSHFTIYRSRYSGLSDSLFRRDRQMSNLEFNVSQVSWDNEIGLIDFIKNSKLQAFLSVEANSNEVIDKWANFVAHTPEYVYDLLLGDILRSFATIQNLSIKENNKEKLNNFGREGSAVIITGNLIPLFNKKDLLLSVIDGFEMDGIFDLFIDTNNRLISYGKNLVQASQADEVFVIKRDVLPYASKVIIPEVPNKAKDKIIFSGKIMSQSFEEKNIYALNPNLDLFTIPNTTEKVVMEGDLRNGSTFPYYTNNSVSFVSGPSGVIYDSIAIDCRIRPVIYGPKAEDNKIKLQNWKDGSQE